MAGPFDKGKNMDKKLDEEELGKIQEEAWKWFHSRSDSQDYDDLVEEIHQMEVEHYRGKNIVFLKALIPEDADEFGEFENIHEEPVICTGAHEKVEEHAPAVPTWIFRPGKNAEGEISGWRIGKEGSEKFVAFKLEGLDRTYRLLERWTSKKKPTFVSEMDGKHRTTLTRCWKLALSELTAAAAGDHDLEDIVAHLSEYVHFGTRSYYDPEKDVINWILE
ncbi:MAG: hypothetical protein ACLQVJ_08010 [Syntrophobacteraceae bacterium]